MVYRVVEHSERSFAYAMDWLIVRALGEFANCLLHSLVVK